MSTRASLDLLTIQFLPYLPLTRKTIWWTLYRMWLPMPVGMETRYEGVRSALLDDPQLQGTIENEVIRRFAAAAEANEIDLERAHGWVRQVTHWKTRDYAEAHVRKLALELSLHGEEGEFLDHLAPCDDTPEVLVLRNRESRQLEALLSLLKLEDRELIQARIVDECHYDELAGIFGGTPAALRQRVKRLLERLRELAEKVDEFDLCA